MRSLTSFCALAAMVVAQPISAQEIPPLTLLVERLGNDAEICSVSEADVEAAARSAARYNRLNIVRAASNTLYVNVNVISSGTSCSYNLSTEINGYSTVDFGGTSKFAKVIFCHVGGTGISPKVKVSSQIIDMLKQSIDRCLAKL